MAGEMIERVAEALFKKMQERVGNESLAVVSLYYEFARVAIEAMREPTDAMSGDFGETRQSERIVIWGDMIERALKE